MTTIVMREGERVEEAVCKALEGVPESEWPERVDVVLFEPLEKISITFTIGSDEPAVCARSVVEHPEISVDLAAFRA